MSQPVVSARRNRTPAAPLAMERPAVRRALGRVAAWVKEYGDPGYAVRDGR